MSYNVNTIANFFISKAVEEKSDICLMKLMKVCIISQGYYLAFNKTPLFLESIEAWKFGPVIPHLYTNLKHLRLSPIGSLHLFSEPEKLTKDDVEFLEEVWFKFKSLNRIDIANFLLDKSDSYERISSEVKSGKRINNTISLCDLRKDFLLKINNM